MLRRNLILELAHYFEEFQTSGIKNAIREPYEAHQCNLHGPQIDANLITERDRHIVEDFFYLNN